MKQKAIIIMFEGDASDAEVKDAIKHLTEMRDGRMLKIDYVQQTPEEVEDEYGPPVVYQP